MPDDVETGRRVGQNTSVAITEEHVAGIVPEGVVIVPAIVDEPEQRHTLSVDRITLEHGPVVRVRGPQSIVGLVHRLIAAGALALGPHRLTGCLRRGVTLVVDGALWLTADPRKRDRPRRAATAAGRRLDSGEAKQLIQRECVQRGV